MSTLQLGLIVAGIVLVIAVVIFNGWQERRLRRRLAGERPASAAAAERGRRVEPTLRAGERDGNAQAQANDAGARDGSDASATRGITEPPATPFAIPMDEMLVVPQQEEEEGDAADAGDTLPASTGTPARRVEAVPTAPTVARAAATAAPGTRGATAAAASAATQSAAVAAAADPDADIECVAYVTPPQAIGEDELPRGLDTPLGKRVRWLGRAQPGGSPWHALGGAAGPYAELAGCLLLADRKGPANEAQIGAFLRLASELGRGLDAAVAAPSAVEEARRAQALDRLCAELDIQIGLTVHKPEPGTVAGTRLRGVAEAAGFRLAAGGGFEHLHEDTGAVLYTLHNVRSEPLTAESLRLVAVQGVVFLLDVPRVHDPARVFDQMKLVARRMAHTLGADLVDDNRRPLDDAALAKIRAQVQAAADALAQAHIQPGSARAQALFSA